MKDLKGTPKDFFFIAIFANIIGLYFFILSPIVSAASVAASVKNGKVGTVNMSENESKVFCYHGSPGTGRDFDLVAGNVPGHTLIAVQRKGYPVSGTADIPFEGKPFSGDDKRVLFGYSWGCLAALRDCAANVEKVKSIVLVSPYLGGKEVSGFKKFLMTWKFPGHTIVGLMANSIVEKLLTKSSDPKSVPPEYRVIGEELKNVEVLARSVMEKADSGLSAEEACRIIKDKDIPVLLIVGKGDKNEDSQKYGKDIENWLSPQKTLYVEDGGHALLWTHVKLLGKEISAFLDK